MHLTLDQKGLPVLLAEAALKPGKQEVQIQIGPLEIVRREDAVREAAREFESFTAQDVRELLKGRTNRPLTDEEIATFTADVRAQVLVDLVDALDQRERGLQRGRRMVRVQAPRGYIVRIVKALSVEEFASILNRLQARGWTSKQLSSLAKKYDRPETRDASKDVALAESDHHETSQAAQPVVEIKPSIIVQPPPARTTRRVVNRDERGLITSIDTIEVDDAG